MLGNIDDPERGGQHFRQKPRVKSKPQTNMEVNGSLECWSLAHSSVSLLSSGCNFMCHEKCLKTLRTVCTCMAPSQVQAPMAHCFGPAGQKKRFCCVCRKQTEGSTALRCEVCELHVHADCAAFTCADCRICHLDGNLQQLDTFHHHWREGNLASAARCEVCRRSCGSSEVLAGMRCEWCGITSHAACYLSVPTECILGRLRCMLLHPACVRLESRNFSKMHSYRITENNSDAVDPSAAAAKDVQPAPPESGKQVLKVFDGDDAVKRSSFRLVSISRAPRNEEVEAALRAFYLPNEPSNFELQEVCVLQRPASDDVLNRNAGAPDNRGSLKDTSDSCLLRAKPRNSESIKVYTIPSVVPSDPSQNCCSFHCFCPAVQRQTLSPQEKVLDKLQEIRKVSLRQMNQTRFYLVENRNPAVQVNLLIGGLPLQKTKEEYVQLLQKHLAVKSEYSSAGAVALQISCFSEAERIYMLAKDTSVENKLLSSLVIPEIEHNKLGADVCPLLLFVNPKSGGLKGRELLYSFRKLLNPHQVFDLCNGGPLAGLHTFRNVPRFRVLVCGGDGTVGWVLGVLEAVRHKLVCREPPIGIVPLGTGNDLARILRWGSGYSSDDPNHILVSVDEADEVLMDRWTILLDARDVSEEGKDNGFLEPPKIVQMSNYFGVGIDAQLSLDFHQAREDEPDKFTSRFHNKGVYVKVGLQKISHTRSLHKELQLQVDNENVPLPNIEGLIFLNIPSWGSGADLWGSEVDSRFRKPSINDGLLEVVGVTGVVHMGQVQSGLRSGIRIAQGTYVRLTVRNHLPVQVDGEPWIQPPGLIIISAAGPKVRMLRRSKQKQKKSSAVRDGRSESPSSRDGGH
uniref:Diacylglycerol kinase n=1 Tax=Kryptolebias marmoratus TaxID=37003 RepID=A0A3Q3A8L9_KRYMA